MGKILTQGQRPSFEQQRAPGDFMMQTSVTQYVTVHPVPKFTSCHSAIMVI